MLRGRGRGECELAFSDEHQVANVNQRIWQVGENADGVATEDEVHAHEHAAGNAPVPERHWNHAFALTLRGHPLYEKPHREKSVPDEAKNHEITPIEAEKSVFFSDPRDSDECECVHRRSRNRSVIPSEVEESRSITSKSLLPDSSTSLRMTPKNHVGSFDSTICHPSFLSASEPRLRLSGILHSRYERIGDCSRRLGNSDSRCLQCFNFSRGSSFATGDDSARVTHPAARWSCLSSDESCHRLVAIRFDPFRSLLFGGAADFAD